MSHATKTVLIIAGIAILVLVMLPLLGGGFGIGGGMMGPGMMGPGFGGWGMGFGLIWMVLIWVGIIVGVVWAVRAVSDSTHSDPSISHYTAESALDILKKRYARGEITKQEYEERKKDLV